MQNFGAPGPSVFDQWTYTYRDIATKIAGNHTIKFGGELTRLYYLNEAPYNARPNFGFFNIWDFLNDAPKSESGTFDPTTGTPTAARQDNRENLWGVFVQDGWKVKPSLTLNVGLRYSYFGPLYSKQDNLYKVQFGSGAAMLTGMTVQKGGNLWNAQKLNFGPQFGFAWTPGFYHQRVVIRGGYGLELQPERNRHHRQCERKPRPHGFAELHHEPADFAESRDSSTKFPATRIRLFGYPSNPNTIVSFGSNGLPDHQPGKRDRIRAQHADDVYRALVARYSDRSRRTVHSLPSGTREAWAGTSISITTGTLSPR